MKESASGACVCQKRAHEIYASGWYYYDPEISLQFAIIFPTHFALSQMTKTKAHTYTVAFIHIQLGKHMISAKSNFARRLDCKKLYEYRVLLHFHVCGDNATWSWLRRCIRGETWMHVTRWKCVRTQQLQFRCGRSLKYSKNRREAGRCMTIKRYYVGQQ